MQRIRLPLEGLQVDGRLLFERRVSLELTQAAVAERARISAKWYSEIERRGQQPGRLVAEAIAEALHCDLTDICVTDAA